MKTFEMVALADKNGKTYTSKNKFVFYNKEKGFYDESTYYHRDVYEFILRDGWQEHISIDGKIEYFDIVTELNAKYFCGSCKEELKPEDDRYYPFCPYCRSGINWVGRF